MGRQLATVKYQYATYSGQVEVNCNENDDNAQIIARARAKLRPHMSLPMAYQSYKVVNREYLD